MEEKFQVSSCPFSVLKAQVISLLPNRPHQAMRDSLPSKTIVMKPKLS